MRAVLIRGSGIAAACCARLLGGAGFPISRQAAGKPKVPAIMIGERTQALLCDVLERPDLFSGCVSIQQRVVKWGPTGKVVELPHSAVVLSEEELVNRIEPRVECGSSELGREPAWTIFTSTPGPAPREEHHFGCRMASISKAVRKTEASDHACYVESLENGWLFLVPGCDKSAWLLSVGAPSMELLAGSRLVAAQISEASTMEQSFPAQPRISDPLCRPGWLACGSAAIAFDPLCGDGAGNSAREAILSAALIRSVHEGGNSRDLLVHYKTRLLLGFKKHLQVCREFYRTGGPGLWWQEQADAAGRGIEWCNSQFACEDVPRYRLRGLSLEPVDGESPAQALGG